MTKIIPLGGGCSVASNLKSLNMRNKALFFDYLWNLNDGLNSATKIIDDNLEGFDKQEFYKYDYHPKWNFDGKKIVKNEKVIVHKKYPNIAFIHYDIFKDDKAINSFLRKAKRVRNILKSGDKIIFVYYRCYAEPINSDYKYYEDFDIDNKLKYFNIKKH